VKDKKRSIETKVSHKPIENGGLVDEWEDYPYEKVRERHNFVVVLALEITALICVIALCSIYLVGGQPDGKAWTAIVGAVATALVFAVKRYFRRP
jgi:hypothetical protein